VLENAPRWELAASLLERVPRWLLLTVVALLLAGGGTWLAVGQGARPSPARPVVRTLQFPAACGQYDNGTSRHVQRGFRTVFGDVAVPPAYLPTEDLAPGELWEYGAKTAFYYRGGGPPVTISVPAGWQRQIGLFGPANGIDRTARTLHIPSCPPRGSWDVYVSSFYMTTQTACAPLDVRVGGRTERVWFGLGARCPAGAGTGPAPAGGSRVSGRSAARR
jgi:hypothetical protein